MKNQTTLRNLSQPVSQWQRFGILVLTLSSLLLINTLFFAQIAHATPTPEPPDTPTSVPTSVSLPPVAAPPARNTPSPTDVPAPPLLPVQPQQGLAFARPYGGNLAALAFGSLLLVSMVFIVRAPAVKARRRDEHDG